MSKNNKQPNLELWKQYIENNEVLKVKLLFSQYHIADISDLFQKLSKDEAKNLISMLSTEDKAKLFNYLPVSEQEDFVDIFSTKEIGKIFSEVEPDEAADILEEFSEEQAEKILDKVEKEPKKQIEKILSYEQHEVGAHYSQKTIFLKYDWTIKQSLKHIKVEKQKHKVDLPYYYYVVDNNKRLVGYISYESLLLENSNVKIEKLSKPAKYVKTHDDISIAITLFQKYDLPDMAVINNNEKFVGILNTEDIIDAIEKEHDEDLRKQNIILGDSSSKTYLETTNKEHYKNRIAWIVILMFVGSIVQLLTDAFLSLWNMSDPSGITALVTAIAVSPILIDTAGNTGGQSSSTIIRALGRSEISNKQLLEITIKEIMIAFLMGFTLFIVNLIRMYLVWAIGGHASKAFGSEWLEYLQIALVASGAFWISVVIANILGTTLPIIVNKFNLDEAVVSTPLITTILDVTIIAIYFGLTTLVFVI